MPKLDLQPVTLATGTADARGCLVLADGSLAAVVVRLDDDAHGEMIGAWFLEAGFGPCQTPTPPVFPTLEAAQAWVLSRIAPVRPRTSDHFGN
jgi:hypothetical protein